MQYTNDEIVKLDADSIYLGNLNTVEFDLVLPVKGQLGSVITWKSGHERFLSSTGKVERPKYGMNDRKIPLDATVTYGDASCTRRFIVKVLQLPNTLKVKAVTPVEAEGVHGQAVELTGAAIVTREDGIACLKPWEDGTFTLFINYYTPCTIEFEKEQIHVEIKDEAAEDHGKFFVHVIAEGEKLRNVKVRPPYWAQIGDNDSGHLMLENGKMHHEVWAEFTYSFRIERTADRPELGVICYGPYVLAILDDRQEFISVKADQASLNERAKVLSLQEFEYEGWKLCPLYLVGDRAYHTYVKLVD